MSNDDMAGQSAEQRADALEAKAERLQALARHYREGAVGERATAEVLNARSGDGWFVLHDLAIPGSKANIDHIVVAPGGVFVVDSKNWSQPPKVRAGTLQVGRFPQRRELATLEWEVEQVNGALRAELGERNLRATGVISLTGAAPAEDVLTVSEIAAVAVHNLLRHIACQPVVLNLEQVEFVARALDRRLESRSSRRSSLVSPAPLPRPTSPVRPSQSVPRPAQPAVRPLSRPASTTRRRPKRRQSPRALMFELAIPIVVILLAVAGMHELPLFTKALTKAVIPKNLGLPTPGAAAPTTSAPSPAGIHPTWMCVGGTKGWTVSLSWPPGAAPGGSWLAQTSVTQTGPWATKAMGVAGTVVKISGIHPGTVQWFRAGAVNPLEMLDRPTMAGELITPAGC